MPYDELLALSLSVLCHLSAQLERKWNFVAEHFLLHQVFTKALEDDLEAVQYDFLVQSAHLGSASANQREDVHEEEELEVLKSHQVPARYSLLYGADQLQ